MFKRAIIALALLLLCAPAWADGVSSPNSPPTIGFKGAALSFAGGNPYVGPGDALPSAAAWWGLRAYNAAYATSLGTAITVRRASDNTTQTVPVLFNGNLNVASATAFAGTDATASCTASSTTLTCTGASSTPNVGDPISGVGITQPAYLTAVGTFTGGAGTATLNVAQTVSVAETVTFQVALFITSWADQTGNGWTLSQATTADQAQLLPVCLNTLPCVYFNGSTDSYLNAAGNISIPLSIYVVIQPAALPSGNYIIFSNMQTGNVNTGNYLELNATTSVVQATECVTGTCGSGGTGGSMNTSWGVAGGSWNNAGNARYPFLNGTQGSQDGTSINPTTQNSTGLGTLYRLNTTVAYYKGYFTELGQWGSYFLNPNQTTICHNAYTYWGTATSC